MKVLVTGATGFIGSHLCKALVSQGNTVYAFQRKNSPLSAIEGLPIEHVIGDITQPQTLHKAFTGIDVIYHTAAHVGRRDPTQVYQITVQGTRNVLQAAELAGVKRFIHTSSVAALGVPLDQEFRQNSPPGLISENHTWNYPSKWWSYGYHKYLAELEVQKAVARGLDAVIVNPALVIGPGDLNRIGGDILLRVAWRQVPIAIQGGLNVIHIDDAVRGHLTATERGQTGQRYILGGENLAHVEFLKMAARAAGVAPPHLVLPNYLVHGLCYPITWLEKILPLPLNGHALNRAGYYFYYNVQKAETELELTNRIQAKVAIEQAINWYKQQGIC
jgi:dihydroflavonol-4-reductase